MNLIVSADREWGIGKNGGMLFHMPGDLKYFKRMTTGKVVVMGRKTLESLPGGKPLPNRENIVLTQSQDFAVDGARVCHSEEELLLLLEGCDPDDIFIIGGAEVYRRMMSRCRRAYITKVDSVGGAERFLPDFDSAPGWRLASESEPVAENGVTYRFCLYEQD